LSKSDCIRFGAELHKIATEAGPASHQTSLSLSYDTPPDPSSVQFSDSIFSTQVL